MPAKPGNGEFVPAARTEALPRYERPREAALSHLRRPPDAVVPPERVEAAIAASPLSDGAKDLVRGLHRLGSIKVFPGGGVGIEYGGLLKTAARPDYLGRHIVEAAAHLAAARVDLLVVPGMSGYPVGSMYAIVAGIPALLLKKAKHQPDGTGYPPGSFVIPSYTGEGDVVMSADLDAAKDIVCGIAAQQLAAQAASDHLTLTVRVAGADDIIDKATMSQAVSESALVVGQAALDEFVRQHRAATEDQRPIATRVEVVAWVTPLIKGYNNPHAHLWRTFGIRPFAGANVTSLHLDPPAIGIEGVGVVLFRY